MSIFFLITSNQKNLNAWQVLFMTPKLGSRSSWWALEVSISSPSSCRKWELGFNDYGEQWLQGGGRRTESSYLHVFESLLESRSSLFIRSTFPDGVKRESISFHFLPPHFPGFDNMVDHILLVICPYSSFVIPSELSDFWLLLVQWWCNLT